MTAPRLAALALPPVVGAAQVLLPAGPFDAPRGALQGSGPWCLPAARGQDLAAALGQRGRDIPIDYEHQTLHKEANGQPAPAAGWMHGLRWIEGRGLFAEAELTERARALVQSGEYRYFSPVFEYARGSGEVTRILMGALTNHPAIAGMEAVNLMAAASARFTTTPTTSTKESDDMNELLKKLLAALGLPEDASEEQALSAIKALTDKPAVAATTATPDPAQYVPVAVVQELQTNLAALSASVHSRAVDDVIAPALGDGRLLPAEEAWARDTAKTPAGLASLTSLLKVRQPIAALASTQTKGQPPAAAAATDTHGLTADELAVAAACGMTPEAYAKGK